MSYRNRRQLWQYIISTGFFFTVIFLAYSCNSGAKGHVVSAESDPAAAAIDKIKQPPTILGLDTFYKKYLNASGIPVISSAKVPDEALYAVQRTINAMMILRPDVLAKMIENRARVGILAKSEVTTDLPEFKFLKDDTSVE